jgi:hypothetical protein
LNADCVEGAPEVFTFTELSVGRVSAFLLNDEDSRLAHYAWVSGREASQKQ